MSPNFSDAGCKHAFSLNKQELHNTQSWSVGVIVQTAPDIATYSIKALAVDTIMPEKAGKIEVSMGRPSGATSGQSWYNYRPIWLSDQNQCRLLTAR